MSRRTVLKGLVASGLLHYFSRLARAHDILKYRSLYTDDWGRL